MAVAGAVMVMPTSGTTTSVVAGSLLLLGLESTRQTDRRTDGGRQAGSMTDSIVSGGVGHRQRQRCWHNENATCLEGTSVVADGHTLLETLSWLI